MPITVKQEFKDLRKHWRNFTTFVLMYFCNIACHFFFTFACLTHCHIALSSIYLFLESVKIRQTAFALQGLIAKIQKKIHVIFVQSFFSLLELICVLVFWCKCYITLALLFSSLFPNKTDCDDTFFLSQHLESRSRRIRGSRPSSAT